MEKKFIKSINLINEILDYTSKISISVEKKDYDSVQEFLKEKDKLIKEFNVITKNNTFSEEEKSEINIVINEIKKIEKEYIEKLNSFFKSIKAESKNIQINKKLASAYKIATENKPKIYDSKE